MRELILKLSDDVGQLLVAGAHLAPSSSELSQDREALGKLVQQFGAKAPALAKLAETAEKTQTAPANTVANELMNLMQMAAQVRAAQTQAAPLPGETKSLEACAPLGTPCNAKDLDDLYAALVNKGQGRMEVIERHVESETIIDLRLVEALVFAMGDSWIGEKVTESAIPKLGRAIVAPIRARLEIKKGRTVDGRRLRALVAIEREQALPLLERAVSEGTADMREAAMDAIADYVPGWPEFEKHALEAIRKEKSTDVRRAAVRALAGSSSHEALEVLLEAIDKSNTVHAATDALASSKHQDAPKRMLAKLQELVAATSAQQKEATSKKANVIDKDKSGAKRAQLHDATSRLLDALGHHRQPEIANAAMELLNDYGAPAARAALNSGDEAQLKRIADRIDGDNEDLFSVAAEAALRLKDGFKRLSPILKNRDKGKKGQQRQRAVIDALGAVEVSEEWRKLLVGVIEDGGLVAEMVIPLLGSLKEKRALKPLMKIVEAEKGSMAQVAIGALGELGDPAALDAILAVLKARADSRNWWARNAVLQLADETTVDKVRTLYAGLKDPNGYQNWPIRSLLHSLEARFPGR
jgi:HEAT repeat protein